jgi:hypothetical protein
MEETQLEFQTSLDLRTQNLREEIADTKKGLHEELDHRIQGTQVEIETARREFQTQLKEVEACGRRAFYH